jgi:hypothetical protein
MAFGQWWEAVTHHQPTHHDDMALNDIDSASRLNTMI